MLTAFSTDEDLRDETNVMGIDPKDLGSFTITVVRRKYELGAYTASEMAQIDAQTRLEVSEVTKTTYTHSTLNYHPEQHIVSRAKALGCQKGRPGKFQEAWNYQRGRVCTKGD